MFGKQKINQPEDKAERGLPVPEKKEKIAPVPEKKEKIVLKKFDVVISGMGPGALATAFEAKKAGKEVLMISNRKYGFVRVQRVRLDMDRRMDLIRMGKEGNQYQEDKAFVKYIQKNSVVAIKDLERFIDRQLCGPLVTYCYEAEISAIDMEKGLVSVTSKVSGEKTTSTYGFDYLVGADGANHHAANVLNQKRKYIEYKTDYVDKERVHGAIYVVIKRLDGRVLQIPKQKNLAMTDEKGENICYILLDEESHKKSKGLRIKCAVSGEIPKSINIDKEEQWIGYLQSRIGKAFEKNNVTNNGSPLVMAFTESQKHGPAKDKMKHQVFALKFSYAQDFFVQISKSRFALVGDSGVSPSYHLSHGLNQALLDASRFGAVLRGECEGAKYDKLCQSSLEETRQQLQWTWFSSSPSPSKSRMEWARLASGVFAAAQRPVEEEDAQSLVEGEDAQKKYKKR